MMEMVNKRRFGTVINARSVGSVVVNTPFIVRHVNVVYLLSVRQITGVSKED